MMCKLHLKSALPYLSKNIRLIPQPSAMCTVLIFFKLMGSIFPEGKLDGKKFLDCACNCGGYCFWAKELGAAKCAGFDVRQYWIDQAEFLLDNRTLPTDGISFTRSDLYDVPSLNLGTFDITLFKGYILSFAGSNYRSQNCCRFDNRVTVV